MYCIDTKKPIFYNCILDPTTNIIHSAGVGNKKDFIEWANI